LLKCLLFSDVVVAANEKDEKDDREKDVNTVEGVKPDEDKAKAEQLPRALHKTQSIFLRNLPMLITRQEIEEVCVCQLSFPSSLLCWPHP